MFQGKRKWVCAHYNLKSTSSYKWHNFYEQSSILTPEQLKSENTVILEGLEAAFQKSLCKGEAANREEWAEFLEVWKAWEKGGQGRAVIFIGCDISKGIVPLLESERKWRDITGWCYQELCRQCNRVDVIWSGLAQTIKGESGAL